MNQNSIPGTGTRTPWTLITILVTLLGVNIGRGQSSAPDEMVSVTVTIENLAPENGTYLTPLWFGLHNGEFDLYDRDATASAALERIAEDGNAAPLGDAFAAAGGFTDGVLNQIGPIAPGATTATNLRVSRETLSKSFFSYAAMIIPSNDAFVANDTPRAYPLTDENGRLLELEIMLMGSDVLDAGTEQNDELPATTAFLGQAAPDTGETEGGTIQAHAGFKPASEAGILSSERFSAADFTQPAYPLARITVTRTLPRPTPVTIAFQNSAPEGGTYQTPVWVAIHDGTFDLFNRGDSASPALERLAEDGDPGALIAEFENSGTGDLHLLLTSNGEIPPFAPGDSALTTLELDGTNPKHQYLSFVSMVIPSNDAFVGNGDPQAYPLFDGQGNLLRDRLVLQALTVYDAGTETNDELPDNTAFLNQTAPNTGTTESGVVNVHPGLNAAGTGGIVDQAQFINASINQPGTRGLESALGSGIKISSLEVTTEQTTLHWEGGFAPFQIESKTTASDVEWAQIDNTNLRTSKVPSNGNSQFFRVSGSSPFPAEEARYSVQFIADWSRTTHPIDFPNNPHFSGLIGATHHDGTSLWAPGGTATPGIRNMAETGSKSPLTDEISNLMETGSVGQLLSGGGIGISPGNVALEFNITQSHPLVTLVSMIAPSPDWFIGVHGLSLIDQSGWVEELTVSLAPYDAGTDSGTSFQSPNQATTPQVPIDLVRDEPLAPEHGLPPIGQFVFTRIQ